ncbi:hypothetical protein ABZ419_02290 [Streptomyces cinnamoneus]|uniref:hypothetical protein n=1 Tax=Streptomyces cinnamoneus TaxID=53446 RepID=UPI0033C67DAF
MPMLRTWIAILGAAAVTGALVFSQTAHARAPITLTVAQASGECSVSWKKEGVAFKALTPGSGPSSFAFSDLVGTVSADLAYANDPVLLARSISITATFKGGFTLTDGSGHSLQISDGQGTFPFGGSSYLVKTTANPAGTRIPVYTYADLPLPAPGIPSLLPPKVNVKITDAKVNVTPEFANALNDTFGSGTAESGTPFGSCSGTATT